MKILLFESNLMWSAKLQLGLKALGHEPLLLKSLPSDAENAELAIVNLAQAEPEPSKLISGLHDLGLKVIAHAGHKEKDLIQLGKAASADVLATNGELSAKLGDVVARARS